MQPASTVLPWLLNPHLYGHVGVGQGPLEHETIFQMPSVFENGLDTSQITTRFTHFGHYEVILVFSFLFFLHFLLFKPFSA